ncbi:MAG: hypothetical protein J6U22_08535 [Bacteroidaceae bacterium]|nr:hypothetical protein [Bacteroidaceae bacterium]
MISKRNKVRISGSIRHVLVLLITLATLVSSCVEGDLYDLYDEDELMLSGMIRKSKQNIVDPNPWWQNNDNITTGYNECAATALMFKFNRMTDDKLYYQQQLCIAKCGHYSATEYENFCINGGFTPSEMVTASGDSLVLNSGYSDLGVTVGQNKTFTENYYIINFSKKRKIPFCDGC